MIQFHVGSLKDIRVNYPANNFRLILLKTKVRVIIFHIQKYQQKNTQNSLYKLHIWEGKNETKITQENQMRELKQKGVLRSKYFNNIELQLFRTCINCSSLPTLKLVVFWRLKKLAILYKLYGITKHTKLDTIQYYVYVR